MKRVGQLIDSELRKQSLNARQMAGRMSLDPALLSRIRSGGTQDVEPKTLQLMQEGISDDPAIQEKLLLAYLSDKLEGNALASRLLAGLTEEVGARTREDTAPSRGRQEAGLFEKCCEESGLDRRAAAAMATLAALIPANRRLRSLVISLANYAKGK